MYTIRIVKLQRVYNAPTIYGLGLKLLYVRFRSCQNFMQNYSKTVYVTGLGDAHSWLTIEVFGSDVKFI